MDEEAISKLRFNKLERLLEAFAKNNEAQQEAIDGKSKGTKKTLTDFDAIKHLIANKDVF